METLCTALSTWGDEQLQQGSQGAVMERKALRVLGNVDGEHVVEKLKGYFSLGKNEIDKAVRAEEWGLLADAL